MSFCTNCGSRIDGNQKFCTNCGAPLETAELPGLETMPDSSAAAERAEQPGQPSAQQPYVQQGFQPSAQQPYEQPQAAQQVYGQPQSAQQPYGQPQPEQQPFGQPQQSSFIPDAQDFQEAIDPGNIWWGVLGALFPLVGIILFFVWRNSKPQSAKVAGFGAIIGICIEFLFGLMF